MSRLSAVPLICFVILFAYACYGWAVVGHWPYYAHPDPKQLPFRPLLRLVSLVTFAGVLSLLVLPVAYAVARTVAATRKQTLVLPQSTLPLYFTGTALWVADFVVLKAGGPWHSMLNWLLD